MDLIIKVGYNDSKWMKQRFSVWKITLTELILSCSFWFKIRVIWVWCSDLVDPLVLFVLKVSSLSFIYDTLLLMYDKEGFLEKFILSSKGRCRTIRKTELEENNGYLKNLYTAFNIVVIKIGNWPYPFAFTDIHETRQAEDF